MICDPAQASPECESVLHASGGPLAVHAGQHAVCLALGERPIRSRMGTQMIRTVPEQVNVAVAQNLRASDGVVTNMSDGDARGRSFHDGQEDASPGAVNQGYNFAEQWKRALRLDPPFVMVTGWNEWTAGRFSTGMGSSMMFVDQFDEEYSRDIEPMKGGHGDNYYYQLVANVRRYKGTPPPAPGPRRPRRSTSPASFDQWRDVAPEVLATTSRTRSPRLRRRRRTALCPIAAAATTW